MTTALLTHPDCLGHLVPPGHPERPERLKAVTEVLAADSFAPLLRIPAPLAHEEAVLRAHPRIYLDILKAEIPASGFVALDADTHVSPGSIEAALRALGAVLRGVDMVMGAEVTNAFAAVRPPGHHAEENRAMGFCLFSNVAIAAKYALDHHGLSRVAVIDFDVHHGNGTQAILWDEPRALFVSTHQMPLWPFTGSPDEKGAHDNVLNVPLPPRSDGERFRGEVEGRVLPRLQAFAPELVLVSAGFDAHTADPLAQLHLREDDFAWVTERLCDIADAHCGGRLVSTLEGGYDLDALAACVAAHVKVLMERGV
ncbi:acetoin utilization deacetylase AcuC-like enzyme [Rhodovulum bhavnagarense]|uniref:Acetoin utilization deacetylase AcuC-like enzyme n=1 Tax=Rhodovulum bhavnagarense TaxID=992286 RepID=A0A4R2RMB8_9RHOB|nr:histone deacetylase family protein [Rhodovulum bhavnagarense]TCP60345.1 acetoin utilization deacetylase AcuC-like enzyme [Rhodovulum bhavnagarense]